MPPFLRIFPLFIIVIILSLLPFFEGGETATGLFLIHTLVLFGLALVVLCYPHLCIPHFVLMLLPFLGVLLINTWLTAPYKFAAFLGLLDYCMALLFAILLQTAYQQNETQLGRFAQLTFILVSIATLVSLIPTTYYGARLRGSFVNPNDFASFTFLLILLGLFQYEHQGGRISKMTAALLLLCIALATAGASSRAILIAVCIFGAAYYLKKKPKPAVFAAIVVLVVIASYTVTTRFSGTDPYRYYRFKIWKHTLMGVLHDPYLGIGLNMLQHQAEQFIFPAGVEVGRYARVARTADNQYFQILAETGFLGLFTFLIGWIALYLSVRRFPDRFLLFRYAFFLVSLLAVFLLPLMNTAIFFLFLAMILLPMTFEQGGPSLRLPLRVPVRIVTLMLTSVVFIFVVLFPYLADRQWYLLARSTTTQEAEIHLRKAVRYNPYQPYYRFTLIKWVVDSNPQLKREQWASIVNSLNEAIRLNPLDANFYLYKAKAFRQQLVQTESLNFYSLAVSSYHAALDRSPYNVFLRAEFALFLMQAGRLDLADAELHKILDAEPAYLNARLLLAEVHWKNHNIEKGRAEFQKEEELERRYRDLARSTQDRYMKKLLSVNSPSKQAIKKMLFKDENSPPGGSNL